MIPLVALALALASPPVVSVAAGTDSMDSHVIGSGSTLVGRASVYTGMRPDTSPPADRSEPARREVAGGLVSRRGLTIAEGRASVYSADDPGGYGGGGFVGCVAAAHREAPECCAIVGRGRSRSWRCELECVRLTLLARGLHAVALRDDVAPKGGRVRICNAERPDLCVDAIRLDSGPWMQRHKATGKRVFFRERTATLRDNYEWSGVADLSPATWRALGGTGHLRVRIEKVQEPTP